MTATTYFTVAGDARPEEVLELLVDGRWRWVLSEPDAYKRGVCPPT
jgi:hypothetical protein